MNTQQTFLDVPPPPALRDMPPAETPLARIQHFGPTALSVSELISILAGGEHQIEIGHQLMSRHRTLRELSQTCNAELLETKHVGAITAARIKAAMELGRRQLIESEDTKPQITSPADAANLVQLEMSQLTKEQVRVVVLNTRNRVMDVVTVYAGSMNTSLVRISELFEPAIRRTAAAIILIHNHPSGDPTPSPEDVRLTEMVVQAGKLLDIEVLDHLIIGQGRFVSLKERGLGFR